MTRVDNDCDGDVDDAITGLTAFYLDADGDGYGDSSTLVSACDAPDGMVEYGDDCDDDDDSVHPSALETCDDVVDKNCDGFVGATDEDGDGFSACEECDDADPDVNPDALETCDGIDNNCDGEIDEDAVDMAVFYPDEDGDGCGAEGGEPVYACAQPDGYADNDSDCADETALAYPGAPEACSDEFDMDCDGSPGLVDADGDGYSSCDDCNDGDPEVYPGADEFCDGLDNNCDGSIDEGTAVDAEEFFADADGDGFGASGVSVLACEAPDGFGVSDLDCDDADAATYPGAPESCEEAVDRNCDGAIGDEDGDGDGLTACEDCDDSDPSVTSATTFYQDADGDGYGDSLVTLDACVAPDGFITNSEDCNDAEATVNPDANEQCDDLDNDCDGEVDEDATDASEWYADLDDDGYGDSAADVVLACTEPDHSSARAGDCDDEDAGVNPGADETCDGKDNNCNAEVDEGAEDLTIYYLDADGDGYGASSEAITACDQPDGTSLYDGDCDDSDAGINPAAEESCDDDVDLNCDGSAGSDDLDGDGVIACEDCDDSDPDINPDAEEICDLVDNDCDGDIDVGAVDATAYYVDADGDGYGTTSEPEYACEALDGYADNDLDCFDDSALVYPGAEEACSDTEDMDCDGTPGFVDADGDGFSSCDDCDDADPDVKSRCNRGL